MVGAAGLAVALICAAAPASASPAHPATAAKQKKTTVIVQGGTTPTDSGLLAAVIEPGFEKAYPQYKLDYVSVGTGQALTNAEAGEADAVFTHSPTLENTFVQEGYSYEPGGRLIMSSDFVTVGPKADPAGVETGPANDVVAAFEEIAAAGNAGTADFVSRGDQSGTNVKELSIWALTNVPLNSLGEPGPSTTSTATDPWYHTTGVGQGANLTETDQCPFSSGACYTLTDRGTYNNLLSNGSISLVIVSQENTGANAKGGIGLLTNSYHAYAVNPQKEPGVNINLAGALAFLNYLTSPATQAAIGAYPSTSMPAFLPDAAPVVKITTKVPKKVASGASVTVSGTDVPNYHLDPSNVGAPVLLVNAASPSTTIASSTVNPDGTFSLTFDPTASGTYDVYVPQFHDNLVLPTNTAFRQAVTVSAGTLKIKS
jgi:tungstate transport system substrate-binding protein